MARVRGVSVEGKLVRADFAGCVASEPDQEHGYGGIAIARTALTDPAEAERFVGETEIDALDVVIGTSRGAYKFLRPPEGDVLAMDRIQAIHQRLPNTHLVMHGSSSVTQHLQDMINHYGGDISQTWGVPLEEIQMWHSAWHPQDQRRHRQSTGDDRRHPQAAVRESGDL